MITKTARLLLRNAEEVTEREWEAAIRVLIQHLKEKHENIDIMFTELKEFEGSSEL